MVDIGCVELIRKILRALIEVGEDEERYTSRQLLTHKGRGVARVYALPKNIALLDSITSKVGPSDLLETYQ
jgi:streptomycin 6-kinase